MADPWLSALSLLYLFPLNLCFSRTEILDPDGLLTLTWEMKESVHQVTFSIDALTTGWILFGISKNGSFANGDFILGGVFPNGSSYFSDRHGVRQSTTSLPLPVPDKRQDWKLEAASEKYGRTRLNFSRSCDTGEEEDVPFSVSTMFFHYAVGSSDAFNSSTFATAVHGLYPVNMLDYAPPHFHPSLYGKVSFEMGLRVPAETESSRFMIHSTPKFKNVSHIVAFIPQVSEEVEVHLLSFTLYKCEAPKGAPEGFFQSFKRLGIFDEKGELLKLKELQVHCPELVFAWAPGVRSLILPPRVGVRNGNGGGREEVYLMEVNLKNPDKVKDNEIDLGIDLYLSTSPEDSIKYDAGVFNVAKKGSFVIPPGSRNFRVSGICSKECTGNALPSKGVKIFAAQMHAHQWGRNMSIRHIRSGVEHPLISDDQNYHSSYQNIRTRKPVTILPGDELLIICGYDAVLDTGSHPIFGGPSAEREESCDSLLYYYPKTSLVSCGSETSVPSLATVLGLVVPRQSENETAFRSAVTGRVSWGSWNRERELEHLQLIGDQVGHCAKLEPPSGSSSHAQYRKEAWAISFPVVRSRIDHDPDDSSSGSKVTPWRGVEALIVAALLLPVIWAGL